MIDEQLQATLDLMKKNMDLEREIKVLKGPQITLGELIQQLEILKQNADDRCNVFFDFGRFTPTTLTSWRGIYSELAMGYEFYSPPLLCKFIQLLKDTVGKSFEGWKGGDFVMNESTPLWVDNPGESSDTCIAGTLPIFYGEDKELIDKVIILTTYQEPYGD